jgi:hypothetical protein
MGELTDDEFESDGRCTRDEADRQVKDWESKM